MPEPRPRGSPARERTTYPSRRPVVGPFQAITGATKPPTHAGPRTTRPPPDLSPPSPASPPPPGQSYFPPPPSPLPVVIIAPTVIPLFPASLPVAMPLPRRHGPRPSRRWQRRQPTWRISANTTRENMHPSPSLPHAQSFFCSRGILGGHHTQLATLRVPLQLLSGAGSADEHVTTTAQGHPCSGPPVNVGLHRGNKRLAGAKRIRHRFS
jgi:hypothetical protein